MTILGQLTEHKRSGVKAREGAQSLLKSVNWMRAAQWTFRAFVPPALASPLTALFVELPT